MVEESLRNRPQDGGAQMGRQVSAISLIGGLVVGISAGTVTWSWLRDPAAATSRHQIKKAETPPGIVELSEEAQRDDGLVTAALIALPATIEVTGTVTPQGSRMPQIRPSITKSDVAPGELVESERELFPVTELSTTSVLGDLYEKDVAKIQPNTEVTVHVEAYPDRQFSGRLTYISDRIDAKTRTAKIRCDVPKNVDGALRPGMFARVIIPLRDRRQVLTVPIDAVQQIDQQSVVFVRQSPTHFQRRDVTVGAIAGDRIEISGAVTPGDVVVVKGSVYLKTALRRGPA